MRRSREKECDKSARKGHWGGGKSITECQKRENLKMQRQKKDEKAPVRKPNAKAAKSWRKAKRDRVRRDWPN